MKKGIAFLFILTMLVGLCACASAAVLTLPSGVRVIEAEAFYGDKKLDQVVLPEGLTDIKSKAFANSSVRKINLPQSLTFIAENTFANVSSLVVVAVPATYAYEWADRHNYTIEDAFPTLSLGSHGDRVRLVQEYLDVCGYLSGTADGVFGTALVNDVKRFQQDKGLTVNGKVDLNTWKKLKETYQTIPVILTQPVGQLVEEGALAVFTVEAENAVSYQWQFSTDGTVWAKMTNDSFWQGNKTDTLSFTATSANLHYWFRVVVTGQSETRVSEPAQLTVVPPPDIQPADQEAAAGETVSFFVRIYRAVSYQWQFSTDGNVWKSLTNNSLWQGCTTDTLTFTARAMHNGYRFRAAATDAAGATAFSDSATLTIIPPPTFVVQPEDREVMAGSQAAFQALAAQADSYRWECSADNGSEWFEVEGYTSSVLSFKAYREHDDLLFRAVAIGRGGETVSSAARLTVINPPAVIQDPADQETAVDGIVTFTVRANYAQSYQWQFSWDIDDDESWKALGNEAFWHGSKTDTLSFTASQRYNGIWLRVAVSGAGITVFSNPARLIIVPPPVIINHPEDREANPNQITFFRITARDADSYRWECSGDGETWSTLSDGALWYDCHTPILKVYADMDYDGYWFRGVAIGVGGETASNPARLTVRKVPVILTDPSDQEAVAGEDVTFTVEAVNAGSYYWEASQNNGETWQRLTNGAFWRGNKTDTLTFTVSSRYLGYLFRVALTGQDETVTDPVFSQPARLTLRVHAPVNAAAEVLSHTSVRLTWAGSGEVDGYLIRVSDGTGEPYIYAATQNEATSITVANLNDSTDYTFYISGFIGDYESKKAAVEVSTASPEAPATVAASAVSSSSIALSWSAVEHAEGYYVYMLSGDHVPVKILSVNARTCVVDHLEQLTKYTFYVSAYCGNLESEKTAATAWTLY